MFGSNSKVTNIDIQYKSSENGKYIRELDDNERISIAIPQSIILDDTMDDIRISLFSLFYVRGGKDGMFYLSMTEIIKWLKKNPDRHKGNTNHKVYKAVSSLKNKGYISYDEKAVKVEGKQGKPTVLWDKFFPIRFNYDKVFDETMFSYDDEIRRSFAVVYWDEVLKITKFQNESTQNIYRNNPAILLVFSYLRLRLGKRKKGWIAAKDMYYRKISFDTGVSERKVSECVNALWNGLGLIYYETLKAVRLEDGDYRRNTTLFSSVYHRGHINGKPVLIAEGKDYYLNEVQRYKEEVLGVYK